MISKVVVRQSTSCTIAETRVWYGGKAICELPNIRMI
jgi:hypothetical protein